MAADISPIEALGYRPTHKTAKERKTGKGKVIARLSMEQFTKDKKRTAVVLLSLAASLSVYLCVDHAGQPGSKNHSVKLYGYGYGH